LLQIPGIKEKTLERIVEAHGEFAAEVNPEVFSRLRGHMSEYIIRLGLERWKGGFEKIVRENPYRLTELKGVGFKRADEVGLSLGIAHNSPFRIAAAIRFVMEEHESLGHAYALFATLCEDTASSMQVTGKAAVDPMEVAPVLEELCESKKLIREGNRVYTVDTYNDENGLARRLAHYALSVTPLTVSVPMVLPDIVKEFQEVYQNPQFEFGEQQKAFLDSLGHNLLILQGDPGTGKTTTTRGALRLLQYGFSKRILAVAPTGKAARRMAEALGIDTMTIHRALGYNPEDGGFEYHAKNKLEYDAFIVDEVSMLDTPIGNAFLKAIPLEAKVILIGDIYQLPSVGVGKILHDMVSSNVIPMIHMTEVYRQGQDSGIIQNARLINEGKFPNACGKRYGCHWPRRDCCRHPGGSAHPSLRIRRLDCSHAE
jgi:exodeoxyribonuclease V alpha subunit